MGSGGIGGAVVSSPVEVYDEKGRVVGVDTLKKNDLLVVYWKNRCSFGQSITQKIQGTLYHSSLVVFDRLDLHHEGFHGQNAVNRLCSNLFLWRDIDKIHFAGHDSTGRTPMFVLELDQQRILAERHAKKMRQNINALKSPLEE